MAPLSHYNFPASLPMFVCLDQNPELFSQFHPFLALVALALCPQPMILGSLSSCSMTC